MPNYTFKWSDQPEATTLDLTSDAVMWSEAVSSVGHVLRDLDGAAHSPFRITLKVLDGAGQRVATIQVEGGRELRAFD